MNRLRSLLIVVLLTTALTACAIPHKKGDQRIEKVAAGNSETTKIFTRYRLTRNLAIKLLDPKPLSTVESGPVLDIDTGSFEVSQRLAERQKTDNSKLDVLNVRSPLVTKYPLWFIAQVRDAGRGVIKVQVFERATAVDTWRLVASPEILQGTNLPDLRSGPGGTFVAVTATDKSGPPMSPQEAAGTYAEALNNPLSTAVGKVENDGFIKLMRGIADTNKLLKNVTFSQTWGAKNADFAARTQDGGALVFATLLRVDTYVVQNGAAVSWPDGSPQKAFLGRDITTSGNLRYYHQVLLYVPGEGGGKPRALGQYGGVVSGAGF